MQKMRIRDIMVPPKMGLPDEPWLTLDDTVIDVVKFMIRKNLREILVMEKGRICGMVRLDDIFTELGLYDPRSQ